MENKLARSDGPDIGIGTNLTLMFALIGVLFVIWHGLKLLLPAIRRLTIKRKDLKGRYQDAEWVIVANGIGCIGQALCKEFAKAGFNIIIISRSNLEAVNLSKSLKKDYGKESLIIKYDFKELMTE